MHKYYKAFFFIIPVMNVIIDEFVGFYESDAFHIGIIRGYLLLLFIVLNLNRIIYNKTTIAIIIFLAYTLILTFFSSNFTQSISTYSKVFIALMMYPLAIIYIKNYDDLKKFLNRVIFSLGIIISFFFINQIFKIGDTAYLIEEGIYLGGGGVHFNYFITYSLLVIPFLHKLKKKSPYVVLILGVIVNLLVFRRTALVALFLGYFLYFLFSKYKKTLLKYTIISLLILTITFPFYKNMLAVIFTERTSGIEKEVTSRGGRFQETSYVWNTFITDPIGKKLVGRELYNSVSFYNEEIGISKKRMIHVDYNILINGGGIIGLFLFFYIYYMILTENRKLYQYFKKFIAFQLLKENRKLLIILILMSFVISSANQLWYITSFSLLFSLMAILNIDYRIKSHQCSKDLQNKL